MQQATKAYGAVAQQTASPRELEASLLLQAASRLQAVQDKWDTDRAGLDGALLYNRKLWSVFMSSVTGPDHTLPAEIRQNVANLGIFVFNRTLAIMSNPQRESLASLISINRNLAAGLLGKA
ncbi:MAG TPA: flagellar biosynthesis regulator FlaF [Pseudorhodoplanes sp.]|jgi:flagellar protein FlaF|nr:flagellar biosynthesis regulator FlaF [Pseudorhodoplanes sp.]